MTPDADAILDISAEQLKGQILPALGTSYLQGTAMLTALLMKFAAREYERGADIRAAENTDMRALFGELAPKVDDAALRSRLKASAATHDTSLTISALNAANAELRRLLIALQTHVEDAGEPDAQRRVWDVLKAAAARRQVSLF